MASARATGCAPSPQPRRLPAAPWPRSCAVGPRPGSGSATLGRAGSPRLRSCRFRGEGACSAPLGPGSCRAAACNAQHACRLCRTGQVGGSACRQTARASRLATPEHSPSTGAIVAPHTRLGAVTASGSGCMCTQANLCMLAPKALGCYPTSLHLCARHYSFSVCLNQTRACRFLLGFCSARCGREVCIKLGHAVARAAAERRKPAAAAGARCGTHHDHHRRAVGSCTGSCGQGGNQHTAYARVCNIQARTRMRPRPLQLCVQGQQELSARGCARAGGTRTWGRSRHTRVIRST